MVVWNGVTLDVVRGSVTHARERLTLRGHDLADGAKTERFCGYNPSEPGADASGANPERSVFSVVTRGSRNWNR